MIPVGTSRASYCCLAFSRLLIPQPGRNAAEKPRWMQKDTVVAGHRTGKGYRQGLAVPPQGLAGCPLLPQDPYSVHTVGMARVVFGSSQMDQCGSGLYAVSSKVPLTFTFSKYP